MRALLLVPALVCVLAIGGCSRKTEVAGASKPAAAGVTAKRGEALAYEHRVNIEVPAASVVTRFEATRDACKADRPVACQLIEASLTHDQDTPSAKLVMRLAPDGVQAMTSLASQGGGVAQTTTHAEDLADAVSDNDRQYDALKRQQQQLAELAQRKDLGISDRLQVNREQAAIEAALYVAERTRSQLRARLETNLLTLNFTASDALSVSHRLRQAFGDFGGNLVDGISDALDYLAMGLPLLLLAFPLALLWRWGWRKLTHRSSS